MVFVGLGMVEEALEPGCREELVGVGEGSWLKSKKVPISGSIHWLLNDGVMVMADNVVAIENEVPLKRISRSR